MSTLAVRFVGPVRRPGPARAIDVDSSGLHTVADLLRHLGYEAREMPSLSVLVDGGRKDLDAPLDGARTVEILIAIGGG
jgi:hypothetical protein